MTSRRFLATALLLPFVLTTSVPSTYALRAGLEGREDQIAETLGGSAPTPAAGVEEEPKALQQGARSKRVDQLVKRMFGRDHQAVLSWRSNGKAVVGKKDARLWIIPTTVLRTGLRSVRVMFGAELGSGSDFLESAEERRQVTQYQFGIMDPVAGRVLEWVSAPLYERPMRAVTALVPLPSGYQFQAMAKLPPAQRLTIVVRRTVEVTPAPPPAGRGDETAPAAGLEGDAAKRALARELYDAVDAAIRASESVPGTEGTGSEQPSPAAGVEEGLEVTRWVEELKDRVGTLDADVLGRMVNERLWQLGKRPEEVRVFDFSWPALPRPGGTTITVYADAVDDPQLQAVVTGWSKAGAAHQMIVVLKPYPGEELAVDSLALGVRSVGAGAYHNLPTVVYRTYDDLAQVSPQALSVMVVHKVANGHLVGRAIPAVAVLDYEDAVSGQQRTAFFV